MSYMADYSAENEALSAQVARLRTISYIKQIVTLVRPTIVTERLKRDEAQIGFRVDQS
jgi:hypothetical protein